MRIDIHCHAWSNRYLDRVLTYGVFNPRQVAYVRSMGGLTTDAELAERFRLMDEAGVDVQVLSPGSMVVHSDDESQTVEAAQFANDEYAAIAREHGDRLASFAVLPMPHVEASLVEIARALDELGMAGVYMHTSIGGLSPADERFEPIWQELDRRGAVVFVHPAGVAAQSALINKYGLPWLLGAPIEDTFAATHLIARAIPLRYPDVKIVSAHLGGGLPMLIGRLDDQPSHGDRFDHGVAPGEIARRMWYDVVGHRHAAGLRCAVDSFGADRIVLGTDFPWQAGERHRLGVEHVASSGLPDDAVELILDRNLERMLGATLTV